MLVKTPVDSHTNSAPSLPHGISAGLRSATNLTRVLPSMIRESPSTSTVPLVVSYRLQMSYMEMRENVRRENKLDVRIMHSRL